MMYCDNFYATPLIAFFKKKLAQKQINYFGDNLYEKQGHFLTICNNLHIKSDFVMKKGQSKLPSLYCLNVKNIINEA